MTHITPLRLIAAAAILGIAGGGFVGLTFALHGGAIFAAFLTGNLLLGLAALAGTLGVLSLAVEIGIRAARRDDLRLVYDSERTPSSVERALRERA